MFVGRLSVSERKRRADGDLTVAVGVSTVVVHYISILSSFCIGSSLKLLRTLILALEGARVRISSRSIQPCSYKKSTYSNGSKAIVLTLQSRSHRIAFAWLLSQSIATGE